MDLFRVGLGERLRFKLMISSFVDITFTLLTLLNVLAVEFVFLRVVFILLLERLKCTILQEKIIRIHLS